ncbi:MAG: SET domain-containing protein-lysine N-methyltransferase [Planctomycetota bacterium]|nr:SET domain-containing protein-lysine N-methyltransferase [Planctomycetota bacterium]
MADDFIDVLEFSSTDLEIRSNENGTGRGVFAKRRFVPGELVLKIDGQVIDDPAYDSLYCMDLGNGRVLEPGIPGGIVNHSCDPNCQLFELGKFQLGLEALVNIQPGRELTYNYGWPADAGPQKCHCGSLRCRKYIVDPDELPKLLKLIKKKKKKKKKSRKKK